MNDTNDTNTELPSLPPSEKNDAFIGGYVPRRIKTAIQNEAIDQGRNFSQQLIVILKERYAAKSKSNNRKR